MAQKGEIVVKKWVLGAKMLGLGLEKLRACNQTRKLKWCKMQVLSLKVDMIKGAEGWK